MARLTYHYYQRPNISEAVATTQSALYIRIVRRYKPRCKISVWRSMLAHVIPWNILLSSADNKVIGTTDVSFPLIPLFSSPLHGCDTRSRRFSDVGLRGICEIYERNRARDCNIRSGTASDYVRKSLLANNNVLIDFTAFTVRLSHIFFSSVSLSPISFSSSLDFLFIDAFRYLLDFERKKGLEIFFFSTVHW